MKRRRFIHATSAGFLTAFHQAHAATSMNDIFEKAARLFQVQVDAGKVESAVFDIRRGSFANASAFGKATSPEALFLIASITKTMTAAGVMILSDRGELKLSDPVSKYIPEFSKGDRRSITIKQLLTHTSGLPDQLPQNADLRQAHAPMNEFVEGAVQTELLFKPGTQYNYQSMGILLAAEVVQRISKKSIHDFLRAELFLPLGMKHTVLGMGDYKMSEVVRGQIENAAKESGGGAADTRDWDWNSSYWRNFGAPWGGAHSTAGDVAIFLRSFLHPDGKVLKEETARAMVQNHNQGLDRPRGLGFDVSTKYFGQTSSEKTFGHRGSTGTIAWADPDTDVSCVILTSLPLSVSWELLLKPVTELVSESTQ